MPSETSAANDAGVNAEAFSLVEEVVGLVKANKLPGPVVPDLLARVVKLCMNPEVSFSEISTFCSQHQALSARLLAVVNSAYYMRDGGRISSLQNAISRIGLKQTSSLLYAMATRSYLVGKDPGLRGLILENLERAYLVALAGQELATVSGSTKGTEAYTLGLFHNIGFTFLLYAIGLLQDRGGPIDLNLAAVKVIGRRRGPDLNELLCREMALPEGIVGVLLFPKDPTPQVAAMITVVHHAIWCADHLLQTRNIEALKPDIEAEVIGLSHDKIDAMRDKAAGWLSLLEAYQKD